MNLQKELIDGIEIIYSPKDITYKNFLVCIPGGGKTVGASRFEELQERLYEQNIGSASINFKGIEGSVGTVESDNLKNRIDVTITIIKWIEKNFTYNLLSLYGVSMGGYIVLGVQQESKCNGKIIIHTPAAYAKESIKVNFDEQFTNILRTPDSWKNSESFDWLKNINNQTLLILHSEDEVIPQEISETYKNIILEKENSKVLEVEGAKHSIWTNEDISKDFKEQMILEIINFL